MLDEDSDDDFEGYYDETDDCEGNQELNNGDVAHEICNIDNITADATTINSSSIYSSDVGEPTPCSSTGPSLCPCPVLLQSRVLHQSQHMHQVACPVRILSQTSLEGVDQ